MKELKLDKGLCFDQTYKELYEKLFPLKKAEVELHAHKDELCKKESELSDLKDEIAKLSELMAKDEEKANNRRSGFFGAIANIFNDGVGKVHQISMDKKTGKCNELEKNIGGLKRKIDDIETLRNNSSELIDKLDNRRSELAKEYSPREYFEIEGGVLKKCLYGAIEIAIIPDDVKVIDKGVFEGMKLLKTVALNNVRHISPVAFENCSSLTYVDLCRCTCIDANAFWGCESLIEADISRTNILGYSVFHGCSHLESIVLPDSLEGIPYGLCDVCINLKSVVIPGTVKNIGGFAFSWCTNLESIVIPDSVIEIHDYTFNTCTNLKSLKLGKSVQVIGNHAFEKCTEIESVSIPRSVKKIGEYAFQECRNLTISFEGDSANISKGQGWCWYCKKVN